ncbi:hypothetical protein V6246_01050 [Algibacter sp. TI.3.09]|uniref:hypothetical protein n=1 Tax=Algibacter sp. TI.3.09 TaxID=3121298 RepID=UPI00311F786E
MRNIYINIFFLIAFSNSIFGQEHEEKHIDYSQQRKKVRVLVNQGEMEQALILSIDIIEKAKKHNEDDAVALGYIQISGILCTIGKHLESLQYLDLANQIISEEKLVTAKIKIYENYGRNYSALKLNDKSIKFLNKGLRLYETKKTASSQLLATLYVNKASAFLNTKHKIDSSLFYLHKSLKIKESSFKYAVISNYYLKTNRNIDSARYYLNRSKVLMQGEKVSAYHKSILLQAQGNFYKSIGEYQKAIDYYEECLNISIRMKKYIEVKLVYKLLSETYELLNQESRAHEYLLKYTTFNDSVNTVYKKNVDVVISGFLNSQEQNHKEKEKKFSYLLGVGVLLFIAITGFVTFYYREKRLGLIKEKENVIKQKNLERDKLKQKLNVAFDEVISLAKENDASFLIRFQEVYPNVCEKLLEVNTKLVNTELSLCAMIWLNFSSKDIAAYTNIQPKTVQTKKYRLRKKLELPEGTNLYVWIKNL